MIYVNNNLKPQEIKVISFKSLNFLSECTQNSHCTASNKGVCDTGSNECQCDSGFVPDGNNCVGMLPFEKRH